jgi:hypothetical protein
MSTSHHPQTDGQTERAITTLEEMIRHYINYQQNNWRDLLPALEHFYNSKRARDRWNNPFYDDILSDSQKHGEHHSTEIELGS